jgi:hypothetical protein
MTPRSSDNHLVRPGLSEAIEELGILEKLTHAVWAAISEFSKRPSFNSETGEVELGIHDSRQELLKGYPTVGDNNFPPSWFGPDASRQCFTSGISRS